MSKKLSEMELVAALRGEITKSYGYDDDEISNNREEALKYYFGEPRGDEQLGNSQVISTDVADMIEAVVAGILPAFETDNVIEFEALSDDDLETAQLESDAVNYFVMEENNGYVFLQESLRDALLLRNGFTKTWVEETITVDRQSFEGLSEEAYFGLVEFQSGDGVEIEEINPEVKDDGISVTMKYTHTKRELKVASVDPTQFLYTPDWNSIDLQDIPFCGERIYYTRSELLQMGFDKTKVKGLNRITLDTKSDTEARNRDSESRSKEAYEPSQDVIECFECYYRIDVDGDGISELRKFILADSTIIFNEIFKYIPYATGTPFLQPHRITGLSLFDKLKMVQDVKTSALRQYLDNFTNGNQGRLGYVKGEVDLDDLTNPRAAGNVGMESPNSIQVIPTTDIGASAQALLQYMDTVRSSRGGASLDLQSAEAQIIGETAQGIERQYSVREQLAALMTRTLAETLIAQTYRNVHTALRLDREGEFVFQNRKGFQTTDPAKWPERKKVNVKSGLSFGERNKKIGALNSVLQQQQTLMQMGQGGIMVNLNGYHSALIDLAKASGIDNPEQYYVDPSSEEAQQGQQAQEQQQQQQQLQAQQAQQQQTALFEQQQQLEKYKHDSELQFKYWNERLDAEIEEAKLVGNVAGQIELEGVKAELNEANNDNAQSPS